MRRPVCDICENKIHSNNYFWDYNKKKLVHQECRKSVQVQVDTLVAFGEKKEVGGEK